MVHELGPRGGDRVQVREGIFLRLSTKPYPERIEIRWIDLMEKIFHRLRDKPYIVKSKAVSDS
jgi:hypothetical protein